MGVEMRLFTTACSSAHALTTIRAVASMAKVALKEGQVDANCIDYRQNVHPTGLAPALETDAGYVAGANAVMKYLGERGPRELTGRTAFERAAIDSFLTLAAGEVEPAVAAKDSGAINGILAGLDSWLQTRTFLVSERLSVADLAVFAAVLPLYETLLTAAARKAYTDLNRWFDTVANNSHLKLKSVAFANKAPEWYKADAKPAVAVTAAAAKPAPGAGKQAEGGKKEGGKKDKKEGKGAAKEEKEVPAWKKEADKKKGAAAAAAEVDGALFDFRIGHIKEVRRHPDADALFVEMIDVGDATGPREICSGLVAHMKEEDILGKYVVVMCNLKPVKMRGIASNGMVMCADKDGKVCLTAGPPGCAAGDKVVLEKYEKGFEKTQLNSKKLEVLLPELHTDASGVVHWKDAAFVVPGKGNCTSTLNDAKVK